MTYECVLPEEILESIFVRMPTKPLLRLKSISKHWNCIISNPRFMKLRSCGMILPCVLPFHAIDLTVSEDETTHAMVKLPFPFENLEYKSITSVGTFNGIVFLVLKKKRNGEDMILYNPFTGAFKIIDPPFGSDYNKKYVYGIGYDTTPSDLKIVRLTTTLCSDSIFCDVFSLKNQSWCSLESPGSSSESPLSFLFCSSAGTFVNGFLYWAALKRLELMVALDLKKMVFSEIQFPHIPYISMFDCLGTFKGRLCLLCDRHTVFELWEMNEPGFGKSWSKLKECTYAYIISTCHFDRFKFLSLLDDGKLLILILKNQLIIYDMLKDSYKEVIALTSFGNIPSPQSSLEYVESSISPSDMCSSLI